MAMLQELRYALRSLRRSPGFTAVTALSLALGIGANTAVFSILDVVLLRSLPVRDPHSLVLFGAGNWAGIYGGIPDEPPQIFSYGFFQDVRARNKVFQDVLAVHSLPVRVHVRAPGETLATSSTASAYLVSGNYFNLLGLHPQLGRLFSDSDNKTPGAHPVAVISDRYWRSHFGSDPSVVGRSITMGNAVFTVVGIAPPEFSGITVGESADLWIPLMMQAQVAPRFPPLEIPRLQSLYLVARLRPNVTAESASADLEHLYRQFWSPLLGAQPNEHERKAIRRAKIVLVPAERGLSHLRSQLSLALRLLMVVVGVVLLIACANVANLMLARSVAHKQEIAVRIALGASRKQIVSLLLSESLVLSLFGGFVGVLLASWGSPILMRLVASEASSVPMGNTLDLRVLLFTFAMSVISGVLFGLAPAWQAAASAPSESLKEGRGRGLSSNRNAFSGVLVAAQIALSVVLIAGATFFLRSLANLKNIDSGYQRDHVYLFQVDADASGYKQDGQLVAALDRVKNRIDSVPGVSSSSFSLFVFNQGSYMQPFWVPGTPLTRDNAKDARINVVTEGYFSALGLRMVSGRSFTELDSATSPKVAVLSERGARTIFPHQNPIGKLLIPPGDRPNGPPGAPIEIIGVVKDAKYNDLREEAQVMVYVPISQSVQFPNNLVVRLSGNPGLILPAIRRAVAAAEPNLPLGKALSLTEIVDASLAREHLVSALCTGFGVLALLLATVGLYGILSYRVQQRMGEIGVRMALGAGSDSIFWLIGKEALVLVAVGLGIGLPLAIVGARAARALLFGLSPGDPAALAVAASVLAIAATVATLVPVYRATRVDPLSVFRYE